jgi:hypothetical protein
MAAGNALEIPIAWLWAEKAAEDLIMATEEAAAPATFEFRATRDVLALTLFLASTNRSPVDPPAGSLALIRDYLAVTPRWLVWCQSFLASPDPAAGTDASLARNAWRWLERGRLLAAVDSHACMHEACPETAWHIGLCRARAIINQRLTEAS